MPYRGQHRYPDPDGRRLYLQVVNVYADAQTDLTPASEAPAEQVRVGMLPVTGGQEIPRLGERVPYDDDPNLREQ